MDLRRLQGATAALALALAPGVAAGAPPDLAGGDRLPASEPGGSDSSDIVRPQDVGTLDGTVGRVSASVGKADILTGDSVFTLRGTPLDLSELRGGNQVSLRYRRYGGVPWLLASGTSGLGGAPGSPGWLQQNNPVRVVTGAVQRIDVPQGLVSIGDQALHGHPEVIRRLEPGERVTVSFQSFGGTPWLASTGEAPA